jgi:YD repeat-containing protein
VDPKGQKDSTVYDPAGNATAVLTRRGSTINMEYDALNRLKRRTVPAFPYGSRASGLTTTPAQSPYPAYTVPSDVHTFLYDALGRLTNADNADARVKRTYFPNGLLETDSLRIRTLQGTDFTQHAYGLRPTYDRDGRRAALQIPTQLGIGSANTIRYGYEPQLGALTSVFDLQGNQYTYAYNNRGELTSIGYPGQYQERFGYDADGRLAADTILNLGGTAYPRIPASTVRQTRSAYDARDRMLWSGDPLGFQDTLRASYSGLGHLLRSDLIQHGQLIGLMQLGIINAPVRYRSTEDFTYTGLGDRTGTIRTTVMVTSSSSSTDGPRNFYATFERNTGRMLTQTAAGNSTFSYDLAGNVDFFTDPGSPGEERRSYFGADGQLRAVDYRLASGNLTLGYYKYLTEEYRYDAFGRRVWFRSLKTACLDNSQGRTWGTECRTSLIRRTVWDGSQELAEVQMPGGTAAAESAYWENDVNPVQLATFNTGNGQSGIPTPTSAGSSTPAAASTGRSRSLRSTTPSRWISSAARRDTRFCRRSPSCRSGTAGVTRWRGPSRPAPRSSAIRPPLKPRVWAWPGLICFRPTIATRWRSGTIGTAACWRGNGTSPASTTRGTATTIRPADDSPRRIQSGWREG